MGIFEHFPYTNYHNQNIDWLLEKVKVMEKKLERVDGEDIIEFYEEDGSLKCNKTYSECYAKLTSGASPSAYKGIKSGALSYFPQSQEKYLQAVFIRTVFPGTEYLTLYLDIIRYGISGSLTLTRVSKQFTTTDNEL